MVHTPGTGKPVFSSLCSLPFLLFPCVLLSLLPFFFCSPSHFSFFLSLPRSPPLPPFSCRYFTEDVPVLLFTALPLVALGVWLAPGGWWRRGPFLLAMWELILHSCLSHKEHRYVLPIVPVASVYAGMYIGAIVAKQDVLLYQSTLELPKLSWHFNPLRELGYLKSVLGICI